jgi:hypothetical protein
VNFGKMNRDSRTVHANRLIICQITRIKFCRDRGLRSFLRRYRQNLFKREFFFSHEKEASKRVYKAFIKILSIKVVNLIAHLFETNNLFLDTEKIRLLTPN